MKGARITCSYIPMNPTQKEIVKLGNHADEEENYQGEAETIDQLIVADQNQIEEALQASIHTSRPNGTWVGPLYIPIP